MGISTLTWVAPSGEEIDLNSLATGVVFTDPPEGLVMPPPLFTTAPIFNIPGQTLEQSSYDVRTITVHLAIIADTVLDYMDVCGYLAALFNPRAGLGALRVTRDNGSKRLIFCAYSGGLEGITPLGDDSNSDVWDQFDVTFTAYDPFFVEDPAEDAAFHTQGSALWFPLTFPLDLSTSSIFGDITLSNNSDDIVFPIWTIDGPGSNPLLTNVSSGKAIDLSDAGGLTLGFDEKLVIDTGKALIQVIESGGGIINAWPTMTDASELWPLLGGDNKVTIELDGATSETQVQVSYRLRWLAA